MQLNRLGFVMALAAVAACKDKADKAAPAQAPSAAPGSATLATGSAASAVKLSGGEAKFGCIGWSATTKTAACITGVTFSNEPSVYQVSYVGSTEPPTKLALRVADTGDALDDASVTAANATLAKLDVQPFATSSKQLDKPSTTDLGKGASLVWTANETNQGGENEAPTTKHTVTVKCASGAVELVASEAEGVNPTFEVWQLGDQILIGIQQTTAREGEYGTEASAALVDLATCKAARS